jgi:hypothetical protein
MRDDTYEGERFVDFVIFWCPVRDRLACAIVDNEGYYWVYPKWYGEWGPCYLQDNGPGKMTSWITFPINERHPADDSYGFTRGCHEMIQMLNDGRLWLGFLDDKVSLEKMWDVMYGKGSMQALQKCARRKHIRTCKKKAKIRRQQLEELELQDD